MGKSARSLRASSFACAVTATRPSYPGRYGLKRTVARRADTLVSVTRHDNGMRKDSPFATHGRACFVGLRMRIADGSYGAEWLSASTNRKTRPRKGRARYSIHHVPRAVPTSSACASLDLLVGGSRR